MKKQINAYRLEIIELSTSKKERTIPKGGVKKPKRDAQDYENMVVPRLDLSKVRRDSEDKDESSGGGQSGNPNKDNQYKNYLDFLENESRLNDMGQES